MIGLCNKSHDAIRYADAQPENPRAKRFYVLRVRCTCRSTRCGCRQFTEPHYETFGKECTLAQAKALVKRGRVCLECGG